MPVTTDQLEVAKALIMGAILIVFLLLLESIAMDNYRARKEEDDDEP